MAQVLNQIEGRLAKASLFKRLGRAYLVSRSRNRRIPHLSKPEEPAMNLFKGLMFLEGHFTRPEDLQDDFAPLGNRIATERWRAENAGAAPAPKLGLLAQLQFLGGRPMHAGHNLDLDEPFEQLVAANDALSQRECAACG
jgi:hypothetical protein